MRSSPSPLPDATAPDRAAWLRDWTFAHRGRHGAGICENSPAAFAAAIEAGLGIECDVQLTSDGEAMVVHDFTLDRLSEATGAVIDRSAAELAMIRLAGSEEMIPSLPAVLALVDGRVPLLIEVKSRRRWPVARLCAAVSHALSGYHGRHAAMSFDPRVAVWFRRHTPATLRGLVVSHAGENSAWRATLGATRRAVALQRARPDFLACDIRDLPSTFAARQRGRGLPIAAWTIRSPDLASHGRAHADALISEGAGLA